MSHLTTWLTYGFFLVCIGLGWLAAGMLNFEGGLLRLPASRGRRLLFRLGVALVLAEGFRIFLSYVIGPLLDTLVNQSVNGFKTF